MPFNDEQLRAINASTDHDLLISAGAGSGKTNTLSERVFQLIETGKVTPESLLVLTFTNNASYEMKTRILARFGKDHPMHGRMQSCHVQSFDSFRAYLVRSNAQALNVPKTFSVMPDSIEKEKRTRFVEEILAECYVDSEKKAKLIGFLSKFGFKNEYPLRAALLFLTQELLKLPQKKRIDFLANYDERFLSDEGLREIYDEKVELERHALETVLRKTAFLDAYEAQIEEAIENDDLKSALLGFSMPSYWTGELPRGRVGITDMPAWAFLADSYDDLCDLLSLGNDAFVEGAMSFTEKHPDLFANLPKKGKDESAEERAHLKSIKDSLKELKPIFARLGTLGTFVEAKKKALWCEREERFLLELAKEVMDRLDGYKKSVNAFSFADIGFMAMELFENPSCEEDALKVISRFDYIMVDEYQDNDDSQEDLLSALTRVRPDGSRAHLFCVGDAKQSIYAFRGSNVELIRRRGRAYSEQGSGEVIPMNKNYRSAKRLLSDINYIFSNYMRPDSGGIDYLDERERLCYDDAANLYCQDAGNYGFRRIVAPSDFALQKKRVDLEASPASTYEATAILHDIQEKIANGHLVFDRKKHVLRPCTYSDFAILVRRKKHVDLYRSLFLANNIPLNNHVSTDLFTMNPIVLIRSILGLLANRLYDENRDEAHLFASIARSYAYRYDDATLHAILTGANVEGDCSSEECVRLAIHRDPIMQAIDAFADSHRDGNFEKIFLDLLDTFHVISALPYLGDVAANISKVESLFAIAKQEQDMGASLSDFIAFFDSIEGYRIKLEADTVSESKDAVDLMTIHASKGLERKIVYMPSSDSGISRGSNMDAPPFAFSLDRGICFPFLGYEIPENVSPDMEIGGPIETIRTSSFGEEKKDGEAQEHVRILYVSLTRAENAFYFVGKPSTNSGYVMMEGLPTHVYFNPELIEKAKQGGYFPEGAYKSLRATEADLAKARLPLKEAEMGSGVDAAKAIFDRCVISPLWAKRDEALFEVLRAIYGNYLALFKAKEEDLDFLATIYASTFYPRRQREFGIDSFASLIKAMNANIAPEVDDDEEEETETEEVKLPETKEKWADRLKEFASGIENEDLQSFCPYVKFAKSITGEGISSVFIDALLPVFARLFDGIPYVAYTSYKTDQFADDVAVYDDRDFHGSRKIQEPVFPELRVDDTPIPFDVVERKRASKKAIDPDFVDPIIVERGTHLHSLLQLSKLDENNLDFIADPKEKALVLRCLRLPLLQNAKRGKAYPEFGYYDTDFDTTGSIDLLYFGEDGTCHIVDYKTSHIDDPDYVEQLHAYRRNAARIFGLKENDIRLHLLSIMKAEVRDVD